MTLTDLDPLFKDLTNALIIDPTTTVRRRFGVVTAVPSGTPPTVPVSVGGTSIAGVRYLGPVQPNVNDVVVVDFNGPDPLIVGRPTPIGSAVSEIYAAGWIQAGEAVIRTSPAFGAGEAEFGNSGRGTGAGDYSYLSNNLGDTFINAKTGTRIYFRINNVTIADILGGNEIRLGQDSADFWADAIRYNQQGDWTHSAFRVISNINESRIAFWAQGQSAAPIFKNWFGDFECRGFDDLGYTVIRALAFNPSRVAYKDNVRAAVEYLPRAQRKQRMKAMRTVHYKWKEPKTHCANCLGSGKKVDAPATSERERTALIVGTMFGRLADDPCPTCLGDPAFAPAHWKKGQESGWFGFLVEEVAEQFPEVVGWKQSAAGEEPIAEAIDTLGLVAILWEEVRDLEARLAVVEQPKK